MLIVWRCSVLLFLFELSWVVCWFFICVIMVFGVFLLFLRWFRYCCYVSMVSFVFLTVLDSCWTVWRWLYGRFLFDKGSASRASLLVTSRWFGERAWRMILLSLSGGPARFLEDFGRWFNGFLVLAWLSLGKHYPCGRKTIKPHHAHSKKNLMGWKLGSVGSPSSSPKRMDCIHDLKMIAYMA